MTQRIRYVSAETETWARRSRGRRLMMGWKTLRAQEAWQTMETSIGVMEMLRKRCWWSEVRPSSSCSGEWWEMLTAWVWGMRVRMMGWTRKV